MIISFDVLGGAAYPEIVAQIPPRFGLGIFWDEFGPAKGLIQKEAARRPLIRVQGLWDKGHSYGSPAQEAKAVNIAKQLQAIQQANPNCRIELSPYCEHEKNAAYMSAFLGKLKAVAPSLTLVNCPDSKGQYVSGFKNELHFGGTLGKPHGAYNASYDGLHCFDADVEGFKSGFSDADSIFYWFAQLNLHANGKSKLRDTKPTVELIQSAIVIAENAKSAVKLPQGVYKSHSQQDGPKDTQGNKPVYLQPAGARKANSVELWAGSKRVATFNYGGVTDDADPRKRVHAWKIYTVYGFKLGRLLTVKVDGKSVGTVDGAFRQNNYRNHG